MIAVSIVSHAHGPLVERLVESVLRFPEVSQVFITRNFPENLHLPSDNRIMVLDNIRPRGFGSNHNAAFAYARTQFFCPLNPDIVFPCNPFPALVEAMGRTGAAMAAPRVTNPAGELEDSVRRFPTVGSLCRKAFKGRGEDYADLIDRGVEFSPDWVAGMFMLFASHAYRTLGGFDEAYHLYYEDVDICVRMWRENLRPIVVPTVTVVHKAQRDSRRKLRFMVWHVHSMSRYLWRYAGRLPETGLD